MPVAVSFSALTPSLSFSALTAPESRSSCNSQGAGRAFTSKISVADAFKLGAAVGIQKRLSGITNHGSKISDWENVAYVALDKVSSCIGICPYRIMAISD